MPRDVYVQGVGVYINKTKDSTVMTIFGFYTLAENEHVLHKMECPNNGRIGASTLTSV